MEIVKPSLTDARLLTAFIGETRKGKTLSALRFMRGLIGPKGKLGFIDTEEKRAGVYSRDHDFDVINLEAPFTPEKYIEALRAFEDAGYDGIVIDSVSHEWEGIGGILEIVDGRPEKNDFAKWKEPKKRHRKFVQEMLRSKMHLAACFRAKEKYSIVGGKPVSRGVQVQQDENVPYEFMIQVKMLGDGFAEVLCPISIKGAFSDKERICEKTGADVAAWLGDVKRDKELEILLRSAGDEAELGESQLREFWKTLTPAQQKKLQPHMEIYKARAAAIDSGAEPVSEPANENTDLEDPFGQKIAAAE